MSRSRPDKESIEFCESIVKLVADGIEKLKGSGADRTVGLKNIREALRMFTLKLLNTDKIWVEIKPKFEQNEFTVNYIFTLAPGTSIECRLERGTAYKKILKSTDAISEAHGVCSDTWFCVQSAVTNLANITYKSADSDAIENALYHIGIRRV